MEKIKFSIVILNYNTGKEAIECIRSIERTDLSKVEVSYIIVDNCSTDNSCELLESEFKNNDNINGLKNRFSTSFINRIDGIMTFDRLSEDDVRKIISNKLEIINKKHSDINITYADDVIDKIIKESD